MPPAQPSTDTLSRYVPSSLRDAWSSQLFPVTLLSVLALTSFALMRAIDMPPLQNDGKQRHDPDAIAEHFTVWRHDESGAVRYKLVAPRMQHFADDDTSLIESPQLTHYRPNTPEVRVRGDHAKVSPKGTVVFLWDHVAAERDATPQRPAMLATMPDLTVNTEEGTAFTDSPVEITQGQSWLKGTGMSIDNRISTFSLHANVTGMYIRPRPTP